MLIILYFHTYPFIYLSFSHFIRLSITIFFSSKVSSFIYLFLLESISSSLPFLIVFHSSFS
jgi:hypothetical protein